MLNRTWNTWNNATGLGRWLRTLGVGAVLATALTGCMAHARGELVYDHPVTYVDAAPARIESYPRTYYHGRPAYLVDDRWYYRSGQRWVVFREEPVELRDYRVRYAASPRYRDGYAARRGDRYSDVIEERRAERYRDERRAAERAERRRAEERREAQRRAEMRRAEQRRDAERRAEARRREERREAAERRERREAAERAERRRAEERREAQRRIEERRVEEKRAERRGRVADRQPRDNRRRDRDRDRDRDERSYRND